MLTVGTVAWGLEPFWFQSVPGNAKDSGGSLTRPIPYTSNRGLAPYTLYPKPRLALIRTGNEASPGTNKP
jgi:hypothetical protein